MSHWYTLMGKGSVLDLKSRGKGDENHQESFGPCPLWFRSHRASCPFFVLSARVCVCVCVCVCAKLLQMCQTLCNPMDCNLPDPLSKGFSRQNTRMCCRALFQEIFQSQGSNLHLLSLPALSGGFFTTVPPGKPSLSLFCLLNMVVLIVVMCPCYDGHCVQADVCQLLGSLDNANCC